MTYIAYNIPILLFLTNLQGIEELEIGDNEMYVILALKSKIKNIISNVKHLTNRLSSMLLLCKIIY